MTSWQYRRWKLAVSWGAVPLVLCGIAALFAEAETWRIVLGVGIIGAIGLACLIGFSRPANRDE